MDEPVPGDAAARSGDEEKRAWLATLAVKVAALAGGMLAVGRFVGYVATASDTDAATWVYLNWWSAWVAGVAFLVAAVLQDEDEPVRTAALVFVGVATLLLGTSLPVGGFGFELAV
jgi:hypothetical protein